MDAQNQEQLLSHLQQKESVMVITKLIPIYHLHQIQELEEAKNYKNLSLANREILLNWILQISDNNQYKQKTKELSVQYIDYYLKTNDMKKSYLQLLGICSLYLASKFYEPNQAPILTIDLIVSLTNNQYTYNDVRQMEIQILSCIQWELNLVSPSDYIILLQEYLDLQLNLNQLYDISTFLFLNSFELTHQAFVVSLISISYQKPQMVKTEQFKNILSKMNQSQLVLYQNYFDNLFMQMQICQDSQETPNIKDNLKIKKTIRKQKVKQTVS